eukprot:1949817-Lingulodinium_polyedra.AAC.1
MANPCIQHRSARTSPGQEEAEPAVACRTATSITGAVCINLLRYLSLAALTSSCVEGWAASFQTCSSVVLSACCLFTLCMPVTVLSTCVRSV